MILNETYYQKLLEKFNDVQHLETNFSNNIIALSVKIILKHFQENKPLHINFQNSKESLLKVAGHLYIELANDIYKNHYDLPDNYCIGDKLKRIRDNFLSFWRFFSFNMLKAILLLSVSITGLFALHPPMAN